VLELSSFQLDGLWILSHILLLLPILVRIT
jgi:hypothetical protein